ncbi:MAG TPA: IS200/IS605 family transposase [Candidatus Dormibacteraeota bacterium]|nr:IS200/IS605 family transposase [Candidatus Dormibacteraeota bacterium]
MAQSLGRVLVHVVFSTRERRPMIRGEDRGPLHGYLAGIVRDIGCHSLRIGGPGDHVHALVSLGRTRSVADLVQEMKRRSSRLMKERGVAGFCWQGGYGAFSIGASQVAVLTRYIDHQEEHHRRRTFQEELRAILERYGVVYDERYIWR